MGIFKAFSKGFQSGRERAKQNSVRSREHKSIKVVSSGRIVEFHILEYAEMYMGIIEEVAKGLEAESGVKWFKTDNIIRLEFPNGELAEDFVSGFNTPM